MSEFSEAMEKHGSAVAAVLSERFESWHIGSSMQLIAEMAREMAREASMREEIKALTAAIDRLTSVLQAGGKPAADPVKARSERGRFKKKKQDDSNGIRKALRRKFVLDATGWSVSTLYRKISEGQFPEPHNLDPTGQTVIWWADEVAAWQSGEWRANGSA